MPNEVSNAVGTQRQFRTQPKANYQPQIINPTFGNGITQRNDVGAKQLAESLGVLGEALWNEDVNEDRRKREQFTTEQAERIVAGQTPEDLSKLDRLQALQNAGTNYDLTDNPYAMATLDKTIGEQAAYNAKQDYMTASEGTVPNSIQDAVKMYSDNVQQAYNTFKDQSRNTEAFDKGFYQTYMRDTLGVAEQARRTINDDKRNTGKRLISTRLDQLATKARGMAPDMLKANVQQAINELGYYARTPEESAEIMNAFVQNLGANSATAAQLNALKDVEFAKGHKIGDEIPMSQAYKAITKNINKDLAKRVFEAAKRPDGTIDRTKAKQLLQEEIKAHKANYSGFGNLPQVQMKTNGSNVDEELTVLPANLQAAIPSIGGMLFNLGITNPIITSGGRTLSQENAIGTAGAKSWHVANNALDIDLGNISEEEGKAIAEKFSPYFEEPLYHYGTGWHLHLGGYKGGLNGNKDVDDYASAYNPDIYEESMGYINAMADDADREVKRKKQEARMELDKAVDSAGSYSEALALINGSDLLSMSDKVSYRSKLKSFYNIVDHAGRYSASTQQALKTIRSKGYQEAVETLEFYNAQRAKGRDVGKLDDKKSLAYKAAEAAKTVKYTHKGLSDAYDKGEGNDNLYDYYTKFLWREITSMREDGISKESIESRVRDVAPKYGLDPDEFIPYINWNIELKPKSPPVGEDDED